MVGSGEADTSESDEPPEKGFDISSFMEPPIEVNTVIGKLFLFPLCGSDAGAFSQISSKEPVKRIREWLPRIASLSPDSSLGKERLELTQAQVQSLSDQEVEEVAGCAY